MNHEKVSTFKATDDEDVPPDLYWKPIRTDSQNIFPQSEGSLAEYKHEVSRKYKFKTHGLQEEQDFEGLPRISGLKWAHEDVEELLAEGHQTSHFESNVHHTGIQSESDWGDQTSSNVNIDSQGKTDSSRHLDINEHLFSSNTMAPLNSPSGPQHPRDTKIMNLDPSIVGAVQEHLHEGVSFELGHYHKTRDWKDSCHRTGKYTSTFHLPGMPETPNPVVKMPFAGSRSCTLGR
ncbi:hypothetical protein DFH28DRAFT_218727 [Melampsora americana]|nr:hypothetical protein DFH28DRAFT_218727 [Melampsora americana]